MWYYKYLMHVLRNQNNIDPTDLEGGSYQKVAI